MVTTVQTVMVTTVQKYPNRLRECMEHAGITQAELARRLGDVPTQTVHNLVKGNRKLSPEWLARLKKVLPYSADQLLTYGPLIGGDQDSMAVIQMEVGLLRRIEKHLESQASTLKEILRLYNSELATRGYYRDNDEHPIPARFARKPKRREVS